MSIKSQRKRLVKKQGHVCKYCPSEINLTVHHVIEKQNGGSSNIKNLELICRGCHDILHGTTKNKRLV